MNDTKTILSIQSHVAYGYVGNRAAVIPLQAMGYEVIAVHTVQLSNHTGYGAFKGDFFSEEHIKSVLEGVAQRGVFPDIDAVLTGYLGNPALGAIVADTIQTIRAHSKKDVLYICDPVMGDVGRGFFVKEALPPFFKAQACHSANIMTPNQFELEYLSDIHIVDIATAKKACDVLHEKGVNMVLLTSLDTQGTAPDEIQMMLSLNTGEAYVITTPKLDFPVPLNGSGDTTAALFGGYILHGDAPQTALEKTAAAIFGVFEKTKELGRRELALIQKQSSFLNPDTPFTAYKI